MKLDIVVEKTKTGARLDAFLCSINASYSRSQAANAVNKGKILVNKIRKKAGYRVKSGDVVSGEIFLPNQEIDVKPERIPLDVIYEDDWIIVINKKPGLVVHPAPGNTAGTLVNALLAYYPGVIQTCDDVMRSGIVHRLDKDTSGLMVVAKQRHAFDFLQKEFKQRRVEKRYLSLVHGVVVENEGEISFPIGRHPVKRKMMAVMPEGGKSAISIWSVKKRYDSASLVEVLLKTGRTHQIRVHFYAIDHPLLGDRVYQYKRFRKKNSTIPRQMLHSGFLGFRHPYSGKRVEFKMGVPEDFQKVLSMLK